MDYPKYYRDDDKYVLNEFSCQFENDNDKINLLVKKYEYKDNKITYSYLLEYNSLNEINKRKEKKSYNDYFFVNHKELNYNPIKNIKLTNKIVEIYENELTKLNELANNFSR